MNSACVESEFIARYILPWFEKHSKRLFLKKVIKIHNRRFVTVNGKWHSLYTRTCHFNELIQLYDQCCS